MSVIKKVAIAAVVGGVLVAAFGARDAPKMSDEPGMHEAEPAPVLTAAQIAANEKAIAARASNSATADAGQEAAFQKAILMARAVKANANDPASIDVFEAFQMTDGTTVIKYRGRNSFNALVVNVAILTPDGKAVQGSEKAVAKTWNRYVAGKTPAYDLSDSMRGAKSLRAY